MTSTILPLSISVEFIKSLLKGNSQKITGTFKEGRTDCYILNGHSPITERMITLRDVEGEVEYFFALNIAQKLKSEDKLHEWLKKNKGWTPK
jgi:hypothetical protein